jgi:hypothetical protein
MQEGEMSQEGVDRRSLVMSGAAASSLLLFGASAARAEAMKPNISRTGAWIVGDKMSLAAIAYGRGLKQESVDGLMTSAKSIASDLGVPVKPLPPKDTTDSKTLATMIHYLIKGDGWSTGEALVKKYDYTHGALFEISVKSNLLLLLYAPGDDSGIGKLIKARCEEIKLPPQLWTSLVTMVANKASFDQVKDEVFKMHKDVAEHLLKT